jgi:hypothetical protein
MRFMPFFSSKAEFARGVALAGAAFAIMAASPVGPAFAGDDGYAPIWSGIGGLVGLSNDEKAPAIDYRERARLVLPPKMELPPPMAPDAQSAAAWPIDPDVDKARKAKEAARAILRSQADLQDLRDGHRLTPEQLRADRSVPGQKKSTTKCSSVSNSRGCEQIPFRNVWENLGLVSPDTVVAGEEPDRDWLTDPPKGFRMPTANTVATFDAKAPNQRDPRALLYKPPDQ